VGGYGVTVSAVTGSTGAFGFFAVFFGDSGEFLYGSAIGAPGSGVNFPAFSTVTFTCRTVGSPPVAGDVYAGVTQVFFYASGSTNSSFSSYSILSVG
jgi:hypothetical protein